MSTTNSKTMSSGQSQKLSDSLKQFSEKRRRIIPADVAQEVLGDPKLPEKTWQSFEELVVKRVFPGVALTQEEGRVLLGFIMSVNALYKKVLREGETPEILYRHMISRECHLTERQLVELEKICLPGIDDSQFWEFLVRQVIPLLEKFGKELATSQKMTKALIMIKDVFNFWTEKSEHLKKEGTLPSWAENWLSYQKNFYQAALGGAL